jgi:leader peptidase (prepilin peptidase)/N-methyltransferase
MLDMLPNLLVYVLGLIAGSLIGVCVFRLPRGLPLALDTSRCDHCAAPLPWRRKLPLLGYLLQAGKTRCCGRPIPVRYSILEISAGVLLLLLYLRHPHAEDFLPRMVFLALLLAGMLIDIEHRLIPDKITLTGIVAGLSFSALMRGAHWQEALWGMLASGGLLYAAGWAGEAVFKKAHVIGGGDVKFAAMIGAFLGWQQGLFTILLAAAAGILFALGQSLGRGRLSREICFGPFLALGAMVNLFAGEAFSKWFL